MINQKLVFHVVIYRQGFGDLVLAQNQELWEEFLPVWCREHHLRMEAVSVQPDHIHLIVEQRSDQAIQRTVGQLISELQNWPAFEHASRSQLEYALFTVSFSMLDRLVRFVESQNQHHLLVSFEEELTSLVDKHAVEFCHLPGCLNGIENNRQLA